MSIQLPMFLLALALLWYPRQWLRVGATVFGGSRARRSRWKSEPWNKLEPGDPRLLFATEFTKPRNYIDLLRGLAGGLALVGGMGIAPALTDAGPGGAMRVLAAETAVLLVGLLLQVLRRERGHITLFAPAFYLSGLSFALCGPWAALFAFVLVWSLNPVFPSAAVFLTAQAALFAGFGVWFRDAGPRLPIVAAMLSFLPVLLSLLMRRRLGVLVRKPIRSGA